VDEDTRAICVAKCVSIGAAKDVLFARIALLEAGLKALREAELKCAELEDAAEREAGLKRKRPEPQDDCFGDENASDACDACDEPPREENYASDEPPRKDARL
jgi:hypothetical protein